VKTDTDGAAKSDVSKITKFPDDVNPSDFANQYFEKLENLGIYVNELHHLPPVNRPDCITVMKDRCVDVYGKTIVNDTVGVNQLKGAMKPWDFYTGYISDDTFNILGGCDPTGILYEIKVGNVRRGSYRLTH
jgi:hypothetical protein